MTPRVRLGGRSAHDESARQRTVDAVARGPKNTPSEEKLETYDDVIDKMDI